MIKRTVKNCLHCNNKCYPWSKGLCKMCFLRGIPYPTLKKTSIKKISEKGKENKIKNKEIKKLMIESFILFYDLHKTCKCEECDKFISKDSFGPINVHHILPKNRYPKYINEHWNFALLCSECHQKCEMSLENTPKIKKITETLKNIYGWFN